MALDRRALLLWLGRGTTALVAALAGGITWGFLDEGQGLSPHGRRYLGRRAELLARVQANRLGYWIDATHQVLLLADPDAPGTGLTAVSLGCTHLGCGLRPGPGDRELLCPCHGSAFELLGEGGRVRAPGRVLRGPASRDLPRFRVVAVGDRLFLER